MKQTLHINGGSAVGHVIEKLREAGIYVVEPGRVDKVSDSTFAVVVDWPEWKDKEARAALKDLPGKYPVQVAKS